MKDENYFFILVSSSLILRPFNILSHIKFRELLAHGTCWFQGPKCSWNWKYCTRRVCRCILTENSRHFLFLRTFGIEDQNDFFLLNVLTNIHALGERVNVLVVLMVECLVAIDEWEVRFGGDVSSPPESVKTKKKEKKMQTLQPMKTRKHWISSQIVVTVQSSFRTSQTLCDGTRPWWSPWKLSPLVSKQREILRGSDEPRPPGPPRAMGQTSPLCSQISSPGTSETESETLVPPVEMIDRCSATK